jgi:hypothetical protein
VLGKADPDNLRPNIEARQKAANEFVETPRSLFENMESRNLSQRAMVSELNGFGAKAPMGGAWSLLQAQRVIARS